MTDRSLRCVSSFGSGFASAQDDRGRHGCENARTSGARPYGRDASHRSAQDDKGRRQRLPCARGGGRRDRRERLTEGLCNQAPALRKPTTPQSRTAWPPPSTAPSSEGAARTLCVMIIQIAAAICSLTDAKRQYHCERSSPGGFPAGAVAAPRNDRAAG